MRCRPSGHVNRLLSSLATLFFARPLSGVCRLHEVPQGTALQHFLKTTYRSERAPWPCIVPTFDKVAAHDVAKISLGGTIVLAWSAQRLSLQLLEKLRRALMQSSDAGFSTAERASGSTKSSAEITGSGAWGWYISLVGDAKDWAALGFTDFNLSSTQPSVDVLVENFDFESGAVTAPGRGHSLGVGSIAKGPIDGEGEEQAAVK